MRDLRMMAQRDAELMDSVSRMREVPGELAKDRASGRQERDAAIVSLIEYMKAADIPHSCMMDVVDFEESHQELFPNGVPYGGLSGFRKAVVAGTYDDTISWAPASIRRRMICGESTRRWGRTST